MSESTKMACRTHGVMSLTGVMSGQLVCQRCKAPLEPVGPHSDHGRGDPDDGPDDIDCPCRGGLLEEECRATGCGYCFSPLRRDPSC